MANVITAMGPGAREIGKGHEQSSATQAATRSLPLSSLNAVAPGEQPASPWPALVPGRNSLSPAGVFDGRAGVEGIPSVPHGSAAAMDLGCCWAVPSHRQCRGVSRVGIFGVAGPWEGLERAERARAMGVQTQKWRNGGVPRISSSASDGKTYEQPRGQGSRQLRTRSKWRDVPVDSSFCQGSKASADQAMFSSSVLFPPIPTCLRINST